MTDNIKQGIRSRNLSKILCGFMVCLVLATGCRTELASPAEADKNIVGTWGIVSALRNDAVLFDTTAPADNPGHFDFSPFSITFNEDGTYTTTDTAPFITAGEGTWSLDQPFSKTLSFKDSGGTETSLDFYYPVTAGKRQLVITFNAGCEKNIYKYTLEIIN